MSEAVGVEFRGDRAVIPITPDNFSFLGFGHGWFRAVCPYCHKYNSGSFLFEWEDTDTYEGRCVRCGKTALLTIDRAKNKELMEGFKKNEERIERHCERNKWREAEKHRGKMVVEVTGSEPSFDGGGRSYAVDLVGQDCGCYRSFESRGDCINYLKELVQRFKENIAFFSETDIKEADFMPKAQMTLAAW